MLFGAHLRQLWLHLKSAGVTVLSPDSALVFSIYQDQLKYLSQKFIDNDGVSRSYFEHDANFRKLVLQRELHRAYSQLGSRYDSEMFEEISKKLSILEPDLIKIKFNPFEAGIPFVGPQSLPLEASSQLEELKVKKSIPTSSKKYIPTHVSSPLNRPVTKKCIHEIIQLLKTAA
jgi:hypothetical protein